jgi:aminopeptidase N
MLRVSALLRRAPFAALTVLASACGAPEREPAPDAPPRELPPAARDLERDLEHMDLVVDTGTLLGEAAVRFAPSDSEALTLEVADLEIRSVVTLDGVELEWTVADSDAPAVSARLLDIGVPPDEDTVVISYAFPIAFADGGYFPAGYTLTWLADCASLFPCHSDPADGLTWTLDVTAERAVITSDVESDAPSYMLAWRESNDHYAIDLGVSEGGVELVAYTTEALEPAMRVGTERLATMFTWLERTLGPYPFGDRAGAVSVRWGQIGLGGMEHHPYWHVNDSEVDVPMVQGHEAAHGWFGNGVRLACWEDLFISEGIVSYLGLRAVEVAYGEATAQADWDFWGANLQGQLNALDHPVRPDGCNERDPNEMLDFIVYGKGAFFLKAVAAAVGKDVLDSAIGDFYMAHRGGAASVEEFLAALDDSTGFDTSELAAAWIYGLGMPSAELGGF